jgi:hypothetical protein
MTRAPELAKVRRSIARVRDAETELRFAVAEARGAGVTWAELAVELGITRQAAQQRFGAGLPSRAGTRTRGAKNRA